MIDNEKEAKILRLYHREKWNVTTIAQQVGVHHSTVQRVLSDAGEALPACVRPRMVDPYVPFITQTLTTYPDLCASRLYQMVKERGYQGRPDHFRAVVAPLRPKRPAEAYLRLHVLPGEQAQVDWAHFGTVRIGKATRPLMAFVMVLGYSRALFAQFYYSQPQSLFLLGHQEAFQFLGGVPRVLLYDNLKSVVLERQGELIRFHPRLLDFAKHYQFEPRPVAVARGNQKGRVERAIQYLRTAFFPARSFGTVAELNAQARDFCLGLSLERKLPEDRSLTVGEAWERERSFLPTLPQSLYPVEESCEVPVGKTPYVRFDRNDYSVPHDCVRRTLLVRATQEQVRILEGTKVVATHLRSYDQQQCLEDPTHVQALVDSKRRASEQRGRHYLTQVAPQSQTLLEALAARGENLGSATAALLRLVAHYGPGDFQAALAQLLAQDRASVHALRLLLDQRRRERQQPPPVSAPTSQDPRLQQLHVTPHSLASYDTLTPEEHDDDPGF